MLRQLVGSSLHMWERRGTACRPVPVVFKFCTQPSQICVHSPAHVCAMGCCDCCVCCFSKQRRGWSCASARPLFGSIVVLVVILATRGAPADLENMRDMLGMGLTVRASTRAQESRGRQPGDSNLTAAALQYGLRLSTGLLNATLSPLCPAVSPLDAIRRMRVALVSVSTDTPQTLRNSLQAWADSGLLDLVDEKIMWLNAAHPADVANVTAFGFRVIPLTKETLPRLIQLRIGHRPPFPSWIPSERRGALNDSWPFPVMFPGDRPAVRIGMTQWFAMHETDADIVLWLEKDFIPPAHLTRVELARSMLLSTSLLHSGASVVRLRRYDDPDREGIFDCCSFPTNVDYCNFDEPCNHKSHLGWQTSYCAADSIHAASRGNVRECINELSTLSQSAFVWPLSGVVNYSSYHQPDVNSLGTTHNATVGRTSASASTVTPGPGGFHDDAQRRRVVPEPMRVQCTSFKFSQWSSNALMVRRQWWLDNIGPVAAWTDDRFFEHNVVGKLPECTSTSVNETVIQPACMLLPGPFVHHEIDGRRALRTKLR